MAVNGNQDRFSNIVQIVNGAEQQFNQIAKSHGAVEFARECSYALQILQKNDYLAGIAYKNPDSLKRAVLNVAAVGLSLGPVNKLAYLVPRKGEVCLDVSYRGYIHLAIDAGAIKWAQAEIVCEKDKFKLVGVGKAPQHEFDYFGDRGQCVGAYCVAETTSGSHLVTVMSIEEIFEIRDRSEAWKAYQIDSSKKNPWVTDPAEMSRKTVIRRAAKTWPTTAAGGNRLFTALDVSTASEGAFTEPAPLQIEAPLDDSLVKIREALKTLNHKTEDKYLAHLCTVHKRDIKQLEDLTQIERDQSMVFLNGLLKTQTEKAAKNENAG